MGAPGPTKCISTLTRPSPSVRNALAGTPYRLIEAKDGFAGLRIAAAEHPGAIILDLLMPGMSGFEVLRKLREDPATRDIPVIVHTATTLTDEEKALLSAGAAAVIPKSPHSHEDAVMRVREALLQDERA